MNHLESKTLKIVKLSLDKALAGVMDLRSRMIHSNNGTELSKNLKSDLISDCDKIMNEHLNEINEWLHALGENKT